MWLLKRISKNYKQQELLSQSRSHQLPQLSYYSKQYHPIWFEFESGSRIDINSNTVIEDPLGLYQFLRFRGQRIIVKQAKNKSKVSLRYQQPIVFYEKDYSRWKL